MIQIEKTETYGWEAAVRGMRNPLNSWEKSDSGFNTMLWNEERGRWDEYDVALGENDFKLMKSLSKSGPDHGKFLRMITVTCDITAPLYWWKEQDTYKVGTVANSCSTMHKIHSKEFTMDDFSHEFMISTMGATFEAIDWLEETIELLNKYRCLYNETKNKIYWQQMIQMLPTSYNQKRTVQLNYQVLKNMYHARKNHKLTEWHTFCDWCETLPYFKEICIDVV